MSLKAFHIFFVSVCTVFTAVFGAWCLLRFSGEREWFYLVAGLLALLSSVGLVYYGVHFWRKLKHVSLL